MLKNKVTVMAAGLFVLLMILFVSETQAQIDTTSQDTTIYPDTTTYPDTLTQPDSLNYPKQSSIGTENYCEAIYSYYNDMKSAVLPERKHFFIRKNES